MAENGGPSWSPPWPAIAVLFLAASSALLYFHPLTSDRPSQGAGQTKGLGYQDVDARLWQDPFQAAEAKYRQDRADHQLNAILPAAVSPRFTSNHDIGELTAQIEQCLKLIPAKSGQKILILPVLMQADAYAEIAEQRLRARVAVLEGLGLRGYQPEDAVHIGYIEMNWPLQRLDNVELDDAMTALLNAKADDATASPLLVPYEWCRPTRVPMAATTKPTTSPANPLFERYANVLVLYLNENVLYDLPIARLGWFLNHVVPGHLANDGSDPIEIRVIGPSVSTTLRAMVDEAARYPITANFLNDPRMQLSGVTIYSPTATAANDALFSDDVIKRNPRENGEGVPVYLSRLLSRGVAGLAPFRLVRTTLTDQDLCRELVEELHRRGVATQYPPGLSEALKKSDKYDPRDFTGDPDGIALVSEWDTFFGRSLPITFAAAASGQEFTDLVDHPDLFPAWIKPFVYLRGIDGRVASAGDHPSSDGDKSHAAADANSASSDGKFSAKMAGPGEQPEGLNQSDYLRRLADQLAQWDLVLRSRGKRLVAVGVLGTDVYDKLLVMRALRDRLPAGTLFFTTGLDARYNLPGEWSAAHNLIIAASYGLRLHRYYQGNIAPFRDSYQTATFAAVLDALGAMDNVPGQTPSVYCPLWLGGTRLYEIGRTGAHDLTVDESNTPHDWSNVPSEWDVGTSGAPTPSVPRPATAQPSREDLDGWWRQEGRLLDAILRALVFLIVLFGWVIGVGVRPEKLRKPLQRVKRLFSYTSVSLVFFCPALNWFMRSWVHEYHLQGEPFAWFEGISIWPTEAIRLLVAFLCAQFIYKAWAETDENDEKIREAFGFADLPAATLEGKKREEGTYDVLPQYEQSTTWNLAGWKVYGNDRHHTAEVHPENVKADDDNPAKVYAQNLWWEYTRRRYFLQRLFRTLMPSAAYFSAAFVLMSLLGLPLAPARGHGCIDIDRRIMFISVGLSIVFTFFVLDATYLNTRFIRYLLETDTHWPQGADKQFKRLGVLPQDLTEYLDIQLIALRTEVVGRYVYFPFLICFLLIVSRVSFFDNWEWPRGLIVILGLNLVLALLGAAMLRAAAEDARDEAVRKIEQRRMKYVKSGDKTADVLDHLADEIRKEKRGAFAVLSQYPWLAAIILPSSGLGAWVLLEYFAKSIS